MMIGNQIEFYLTILFYFYSTHVFPLAINLTSLAEIIFSIFIFKYNFKIYIPLMFIKEPPEYSHDSWLKDLPKA